MRVTLESTTRVVDIIVEGARCPGWVWEGTTDSGIPVFAVVTRIAVREDHDLSQFEAELERQAGPSSTRGPVTSEEE